MYGETVETVSDCIFGGSKITANGDCSHEIKRPLLFGRKVMTNIDSILKSRDITLPTKVRLVKAMVFPVVMWELDYKESWALKNWCFWAVVLEKTLEGPLDCKEIQAVHPKGNQSRIFTGRTDTEAETPILWPSDAKNWLIEKNLMLGKNEGRRRRGWQRMRWLDGGINSINRSLSNSRSWRWTGSPGMLLSIRSQRVGHDWATELTWVLPAGQRHRWRLGVTAECCPQAVLAQLAIAGPTTGEHLMLSPGL